MVNVWWRGTWITGLEIFHVITLASLENQTSNRTAGNTQLMRTASNLSLNIEDPNLVPRVSESQSPRTLETRWGGSWLTSLKSPRKSSPVRLLISPLYYLFLPVLFEWQKFYFPQQINWNRESQCTKKRLLIKRKNPKLFKSPIRF